MTKPNIAKNNPKHDDAIRRVLDHDRATSNHVVGVYVDPATGTPSVRVIARIVTQYPKDGAGTLKVVVYDFGNGTDPQHSTDRFYATAGGCGYDKLAACLDGVTIGGVELGDHSDSKGRPTLDVLCRRQGWTWLSSST